MTVPATLAKIATAAVADKVGKVINQTLVEKDIEARIANSPAMKNATNGEAFYQSGVAWGAAITSLGVIVPMVANLFGVSVSAEQVVEVGGAVVTIAGIVFTLYRRFMPGLSPLFSRKGT